MVLRKGKEVSTVYTHRASAAVSLVDASGVVTSAIMASRNACPSSHHDGRRVVDKENHMVKLIQICASQNDLFGLDVEGVVYHYNFNTNTWMKLSRRRRDDADSPSGDKQRTISEERIAHADGA